MDWNGDDVMTEVEEKDLSFAISHFLILENIQSILEVIYAMANA
jgi:hypothetical protein